MPMLARKEQKRSGRDLPREWIEKLKDTLLSLYQDSCDREGKTFQVYGLTYPDEVFLSVSYLDENNLHKIPVTYSASIDLDNQNCSPEILNLLVDSVGIFFDTFFDAPEEDYITPWIKSEIRKKTFYYQVTREVISLSLQADQILKT